MDKFWSIMTMPIGVALCFGPAVIRLVVDPATKIRATTNQIRTESSFRTIVRRLLLPVGWVKRLAET